MSFRADIKYAMRLLQKKPIFTLTSVLIVAVGLGLTIYTYSLLNQLIFKPLTLDGHNTLIAVSGEFAETRGRRSSIDTYHLNQIAAESELLQDMSMYDISISTMAGNGNRISSTKLHVSLNQWNMFEVVGVQPILGRGFNPQDHDVGAESVSLISYQLWQSHFSGSMDIIGTQIMLDGEPKIVAGVMPEGFKFPAIAQIWLPLPLDRLTRTEPSNRSSHALDAVVTLKSGVSLAEFQQEIRGILQRHVATLPQEFAWRASSAGGYIQALPFKYTNNDLYQHYSVFIAMLVVVLLILVLTCINVGNLLLVRVNERIKEVAIRISLGIPRRRLLFQMLLESTLICSIGGLMAFFFASWSAQITNSVFDQVFSINGERPFWWYLSIEFDAVVLLLVAILVMILVTGFIPAQRALAGDLNAVLRDGTRGALGKKAGRANKTLVMAEIALSCAVLVVASMLLSTSFSAQNADYGVDTENRITAEILVPYETYIAIGSRKKVNDFHYRLQEDLEQMPHIHAVGFFSSLPGTGGGTSHYEVQGRAADMFNENPLWNFEIVSLDAWDATGMKIIEGRDFDIRDSNSDERDLSNLTSPVIINESMAREHFPNGDALGQRVRTVTENWQTEWRTIVGVVSDSVHGPTMQATSAQHTGYGLMDLRTWLMNIVIHYSGSQSQAQLSLQQAINKLDPDATISNLQSYNNLIKQPMRLVNAVNSIFLYCGLVALFLAASGIYAVAANSISLRAQEIATRRALGAKNKQVILLFLTQAGTQLTLGLAVGISLSLWVLSQITQSMTLASDSYMLGLIGIPMLIICMVLVATYIPTNRITKQEPAVGLRQS